LGNQARQAAVARQAEIDELTSVRPQAEEHHAVAPQSASMERDRLKHVAIYRPPQPPAGPSERVVTERRRNANGREPEEGEAE
jgi:hypothetical protein